MDDVDLVSELDDIDPDSLSEWEREFIISVWEWVIEKEMALSEAQRVKALQSLEEKET